MPADDTLCFASATTLARQIGAGELSAERVTRAVLHRIQAHEPRLNALALLDQDGALRQARRLDQQLAAGAAPGPLCGVPVALKDNIVTRGLGTRAGSAILAGWIPPYDSTAARRLRQAGAVLLGKLNLDEFGMGTSGEHCVDGPTHNPWALGRSPGGSSSGPAAAVAAGLCTVALGSDSGGSLRQPAALCGVCGLRPTYGRVSRHGLIAFASSLDQIGPQARSVEDCALALSVLAGADGADSTAHGPALAAAPLQQACQRRELRGLRVAVDWDQLALPWVDAEVRRLTREALGQLEQLGARLCPVQLPDLQRSLAAYHVVAAAEAGSNLARYDGVRYGRRAAHGGSLEQLLRRTREQGFGEEVKRRILVGTFALCLEQREAVYRAAQAVRSEVRRQLGQVLGSCQLIAGPTTPCAAFPLGARRRDPLWHYRTDSFTLGPSLAGLPALSVPCGLTRDGLPVGLQLVAAAWDETTLLGAGAAYQAATEWHRLRPAALEQPEPPANARGRESAADRLAQAVDVARALGDRATGDGSTSDSDTSDSATSAGRGATDDHVTGDSATSAGRGATAREQLVADIGLEIHVQLATASKLFCSCPNRFGAPPNSQICPVCAGLPGALPVLNHRAVELGLRLALACGSQVNLHSRFVRKHYVYPDLPKGYQITQTEEPLARGGGVSIALPGAGPRTIALQRIHLEEDAGKSVHHPDGETLVDLNRAGVPLVELVTEPTLHLPDEAAQLMRTLRSMVRALGVGDGDLERGSLRCDANVSLRPRDSTALGVSTEVKNLNSFRFVRRALTYEIQRQTELLSRGAQVAHLSLSWDAEAAKTRPMRSKELAEDYRYLPEPDLPPLQLDQQWVNELARALPELPATRARRLQQQLRLSAEQATVLTEQPELADYVEACVAAGAPGRLAAGWVLTELLSQVTSARALQHAALSPERLARLLQLVQQRQLSRDQAKRIGAEMWRDGRAPEELAQERGWLGQQDQVALEATLQRVLREHPQLVQQYRAGKQALLGHFIGLVMRATDGRAEPRALRQRLRELLEQ